MLGLFWQKKKKHGYNFFSTITMTTKSVILIFFIFIISKLELEDQRLKHELKLDLT